MTDETIDQLNRTDADRSGIPRRNPYGPCPDKCIGLWQRQADGDYAPCPTCDGYGYVDQTTGKGVQGPEKKTKQTKRK